MSKFLEKKLSLWQVIKSVLSAMLGVQSSAAHKRDFTKGNPWVYIGVGLITTILFVLMLYGVVQWVLMGIGKGA